MTHTTSDVPVATRGAEGDPPKVVKLGSAKGGWFRRTGLSHLVGILALVFSIFPILFVVSASFNPTGTLSSSTLIPRDISLVNYQELFSGSFPRWFLNSVVIASLSGAISMLISACAAYAFSRFRFAGRRPGLIGLLLVQMFPQFLAIVALYLIFANITELWPVVGFSTTAGLVILYLGGALGVNTWLMKGFFDTIPKDLDESAKMDGATHFQVFFGIILPLVAPILAITGLLGFIGAINEFLIAGVFLRENESKTAAVGLYGLIADPLTKNAQFGEFAAGAVILAVPTVALFMYLQRYIVGGLTAGAVKG